MIVLSSKEAFFIITASPETINVIDIGLIHITASIWSTGVIEAIVNCNNVSKGNWWLKLMNIHAAN